MNTFKKELETYHQWLPELLDGNQGNFVVIKGEVIVGIRSSFEYALRLGYKTFGLDGFMVKEILKTERIETISPIQQLTYPV